MQTTTRPVPVIKTQQELDNLVRQYVASDLSGIELFQNWQAIREASLRLNSGELEGDRIAGEDSY